jgi:exodeoxyribonuclease VII large subunit
MRRSLEAQKKHLDASARMLESLSHKSVLARGFAMVHREDGVLVRAAKDLNAGDAVQITFADGDRHGVIEPENAPAREPDAEPAKPRATPVKNKPGGNQGSLF